MTLSQIANYNIISDPFVNDELSDFQVCYALILINAFDSVFSVQRIKKFRAITSNTQGSVINHSLTV